MNFQELLQKINELDQPEANPAALRAQRSTTANDLANQKAPKEDVLDVEECGMGPMDPMKQQDNVSMNITMNGAGPGGIRDLLDILKDIEDGNDGMDMDPEAGELGDLVGKMSMGPKDKMAVIGDDLPMDEFANEPDEMYGDITQVLPTGNDMHSKGAEAPKVNGGGNPMYMEQLTAKLDALYNDIKNR